MLWDCFSLIKSLKSVRLDGTMAEIKCGKKWKLIDTYSKHHPTVTTDKGSTKRCWHRSSWKNISSPHYCILIVIWNFSSSQACTTLFWSVYINSRWSTLTFVAVMWTKCENIEQNSHQMKSAELGLYFSQYFLVVFPDQKITSTKSASKAGWVRSLIVFGKGIWSAAQTSSPPRWLSELLAGSGSLLWEMMNA